MRVPLFLTLRYLRGAGRSFPLIIWVSVLGIAIGFGAFVVIGSVINGFQWQVKERVLAVEPSIVLSGFESTLELEQLVRAIKQYDFVEEEFVFYQQPDFIWNEKGRFKQVQVIGLTPDVVRFYRLENSAPSVEWNEVLDTEKRWLMVGNILKQYAGITQKTVLHLNVSITDLLQQKNNVAPPFYFKGSFSTGWAAFDSQFVFLKQPIFLKTYAKNNPQPQLGIRVDDLLRAEEYADKMIHELSLTHLKKRTWKDNYSVFFKTLTLEKQVSMLIIFLIIFITLFNVVGGIVLQIRQRLASMALLRILGMSNTDLMLIFIYMGFFVGLIGVIIGAFGGVLFAKNVNDILYFFSVIFSVDSTQPLYTVHFPVVFDWLAIAQTGGFIVLACVVSGFLPSLFLLSVKIVKLFRHD